MGAPVRRTIYISSLEAHVDRLHSQMINLGYFPIDYDNLERFKGLNSKTAKVLSVHRCHHQLLTIFERASFLVFNMILPKIG